MAYLHCHSCTWKQDDFYSEDGYNPAKYLSGLNKKLCSDNIDELFNDSASFLANYGPLTNRDAIVMEYEKFIERIKTMKWVTAESWKNEANRVCPQCGGRNMDID